MISNDPQFTPDDYEQRRRERLEALAIDVPQLLAEPDVVSSQNENGNLPKKPATAAKRRRAPKQPAPPVPQTSAQPDPDDAALIMPTHITLESPQLAIDAFLKQFEPHQGADDGLFQ